MMNNNLERLIKTVADMGEAAIATSETVEKLAFRLDELAQQMQRQEHQIQQQGYQIFALSEALQILIDSQTESREQLNTLTELIQILVTNLNDQLGKDEK